MVWLEDRYQRLLAWNLRRRWAAVVAGLAVVGSAVFPFNRVDKNLDTSEAEMFVQLRYDISEEMTLEAKRDLVTRVEKHLEPHRDELLARAVYSFWNDRWVMTRIYLHEGLANEENFSLVRTRLRGLLPEIPGVRLQVQDTRQGWRRHRGGGQYIAFQLVGEDTEVLMRLAEEARERVGAIPGMADVEARHQEAQQELHIEPDRDLMARYDVSPGQVANVVGLTYRGQRLRRFRTTDGEREMRLTLDEQRTESVSQLRNLPLRNADGTRVPLAAVADFNVIPGRENIERDNRLTSVWVGGRYTEGTREDYIPRVTAILQGMDFPYGYDWTFGQWQARQQEQSREFVTNLALALLLVFAVMAGLFESARQALALMIALPFALAQLLLHKVLAMQPEHKVARQNLALIAKRQASGQVADRPLF